MKAKLTREAVFTIEVHGVSIPGMRVKSRWLGLTQLQNEKGEMLIVSGEDNAYASMFATLFGDIFRNAEETLEAGVVVVMGTPSLTAQIQKTGEKE
jgi:hypothetical protein